MENINKVFIETRPDPADSILTKSPGALTPKRKSSGVLSSFISLFNKAMELVGLNFTTTDETIVFDKNVEINEILLFTNPVDPETPVVNGSLGIDADDNLVFTNNVGAIFTVNVTAY